MKKMEEFQLKLLLAIFDKLPSQSLMYIGDYLYNAFKENCLLELNKYSLEIGFYKKYFHYCFELSDECILYLKQEFLNDDSLIYYFCRFAIIRNDEVLLNVYDNEIYVINKSLHISNNLIKECEAPVLMINIEDNIDL